MPRLRHVLALTAVMLLTATLLPTSGATAGDVYPGAQYREAYIQMGDALGTVLHADLLRDEAVSWTARQPVVMVVSPYTNHNDSGADLFDGQGPNPRFYDFLDVTGALGEGYTFVQVDLPGNGGSSGCNDWGGPVEQAAVKAAVEWAHRQPWSNGNVALLGKSYDGWTGLMGMAQEPLGLKAVISQEPVFSGYRYLFNNGVRFLNSVVTPALFQVYDAQPGALNDDPEYLVNGTPQAYCYGLNVALQQQDSEDVAFWAVRDLVRQAAGSDIPVFLTQGFLETNTKVDAALDFWNALDHSGGDHKMWIGQFNHVRGWEQTCGHDCDGEFLMGREVFADQIMTFLDEHLKGIAPAAEDVLPAVAVQDAFGRYRAEDAYPSADTTSLVTPLTTGTYTDSLVNGGSLWTVSEPLPYDVWLSGEPVLSAAVTTTAPRANLTVFVYDVDPTRNRARLVNQGTTLVRGTGQQQVDIQLYAQDWVVQEGHRLAVEVKAVGSGFAGWIHTPTGQQVTVRDADIALPFLTADRTSYLDGVETTRLRGYSTGLAISAVPTATTSPFTLPGPIDIGDPTIARTG